MPENHFLLHRQLPQKCEGCATYCTWGGLGSCACDGRCRVLPPEQAVGDAAWEDVEDESEDGDDVLDDAQS